MEHLSAQTISCPYCGEAIDVQVDTSAGDQAYVEDCQVCCRPIEMHLWVTGEEWRLGVTRDDD